jgi:phosphate-selective porin OprO/OprP
MSRARKTNIWSGRLVPWAGCALALVVWCHPTRLCRGDDLSATVASSREIKDKPSLSEPLWPPTWELHPWGREPGVTAKLRGRVDTDAIWSTQSPANQATYGNLSDVVGLRRARIGLEGELGQQGSYITEIDLASGQVVPRDVYVAHGGMQDGGQPRVGHFREPFSLEGGTSARYFGFMERSPANVFDPARNWGPGWYRANAAGTAAIGLGAFYAGIGSADLEQGPGAAIGFTGRLTTAPLLEDNGRRLLHLGIALSSRIPTDGFIVINQQPRSPLLNLGDSSTTPFVSTIDLPASYQQLVNLQTAWAHGSLWSQAEWYGTWIDQTGGAGNVFYHGYHADVGWFLTGEHREYQGAEGILGPVHVARPFFTRRGAGSHGWGGWELVARVGYVDLFSDNNPMGSNGRLIGVRQIEFTGGVNWYLDDRIRLMFNYTYNAPDDPNTGTSFASVFSTRLGVFW